MFNWVSIRYIGDENMDKNLISKFHCYGEPPTLGPN